MLAIRLQRTGRKGHAQYRVIVQDSRFSPKSGRVVASLGNYDPHTKLANINAELAVKYLTNGAQPSDRTALIFKDAGVKLPKWYSAQPSNKKTTKNPEKLRKNRPAAPEAPAGEEKPAEQPAEETTDQPITEPAVQDQKITAAEPESPAETETIGSEAAPKPAETPDPKA